VARMTAGKALQLLVDEGLAVIVPGMGIYVRPKVKLSLNRTNVLYGASMFDNQKLLWREFESLC
jgi:DNA-binding GntR family transcriptional regulator